MRYLIVTGFFESPALPAAWFMRLWWRNLVRYAEPMPEKVIVLASGGCHMPWWDLWQHGDWLHMDGDLGHTDHILSKEKPHFMGQCAATWMAGAWLAYLNECDFISLEQDALAFGPWVGRMYEQIGERGVIFGPSRMQGAATSLFMVRHHYIPEFVADYLQEGRENHLNRIPETKMHRLSGRKPEQYCQYGFGCDKDRPIPYDDEVFFAQKFTVEELHELKRRGKIDFRWIPKAEVFSNRK